MQKQTSKRRGASGVGLTPAKQPHGVRLVGQAVVEGLRQRGRGADGEGLTSKHGRARRHQAWQQNSMAAAPEAPAAPAAAAGPPAHLVRVADVHRPHPLLVPLALAVPAVHDAAVAVLRRRRRGKDGLVGYSSPGQRSWRQGHSRPPSLCQMRGSRTRQHSSPAAPTPGPTFLWMNTWPTLKRTSPRSLRSARTSRISRSCCW